MQLLAQKPRWNGVCGICRLTVSLIGTAWLTSAAIREVRDHASDVVMRKRHSRQQCPLLWSSTGAGGSQSKCDMMRATVAPSGERRMRAICLRAFSLIIDPFSWGDPGLKAFSAIPGCSLRAISRGPQLSGPVECRMTSRCLPSLSPSGGRTPSN